MQYLLYQCFHPVPMNTTRMIFQLQIAVLTRFCAIPPKRRTIVLLDREIASILVLTSGHVISTASSIHSFTNSAPENGLLCLASLLASTKLAFVAASCMTVCFTKKLCCCCFSPCHWLFAVVYFLTNCFQDYRVQFENCLFKLYSVKMATLSWHIRQTALLPKLVKKYLYVHSVLHVRHSSSILRFSCRFRRTHCQGSSGSTN